MTSQMRINPSAALDLTTCHNVRSLMEAFVDGELSPEQTLEIEAHLEDCQACQANADFLRALSATLKEAVHGETYASFQDRAAFAALTAGAPRANADSPLDADWQAGAQTSPNQQRAVEARPGTAVSSGTAVSQAFMVRLEHAIEAEIEREAAAADHSSRGTWFGRITVFAAAASATLWFGVRTFGPESGSFARTQEGVPGHARRHSGVSGIPVEDDEVSTLEGALDRLIDYHSAPPEPEVTSVELLPRLEPDVGVRMQLPKLDAYGARWEGASLVPVRNNQRAASFRYQLPKNRVTLYVFNASRLRVEDSPHLQRETPQPVYFGQWRGYNVAAKETRGVGYALATDMDGPAVARMINDIH